jgi:putative ABC transport system ATP-binding protein
VVVRNVTLSFGRNDAITYALRNASADFPSNALSLITGPSGSGKTTLLSIIGCILKPDSGTVLVNAEDVTALSTEQRTTFRRHRIGYVFQAFRLIGALSARQNIELMADIRGIRRPQASDRASQLLDHFSLSKKAHLRPDEMSGGEKQRVAIARALFHRPYLLLADEPTASLDSVAGMSVIQTFRSLVTSDFVSVIVVSHDPKWQDVADYVLTLRDGVPV